ncbi:MAG: histidine kinase [Fibrobacteres bacterium]|nr:histidine kinase [Fibrobacterota bacterium]
MDSEDKMMRKTFAVAVWMLSVAAALWGDALFSHLIPFHALLVVPVLLAARYSGRIWGFSLAVLLPMAHAAILVSEGRFVLPPIHLILGLVMHGLTLILVVELVHRLQVKNKEAMRQIKILTGMLPICANCKDIRDDRGYWKRIEEYLSLHTEVEFSHGVCPDCMAKLYPEYADVAKTPDPV